MSIDKIADKMTIAAISAVDLRFPGSRKEWNRIQSPTRATKAAIPPTIAKLFQLSVSSVTPEALRALTANSRNTTSSPPEMTG